MNGGTYASAAKFGKDKRAVGALPPTAQLGLVRELLAHHLSLKPEEYRSFTVPAFATPEQRAECWSSMRDAILRTIAWLEEQIENESTDQEQP